MGYDTRVEGEHDDDVDALEVRVRTKVRERIDTDMLSATHTSRSVPGVSTDNVRV